MRTAALKRKPEGVPGVVEIEVPGSGLKWSGFVGQIEGKAKSVF